MGTRNWVYTVAGLVVFLGLAFWLGFSSSFGSDMPPMPVDDAQKLAKATGLDVAADAADPVMMNVTLVSRERYTPQAMAISTLKAVGRIAGPGILPGKWLKVKFTHKFTDRTTSLVIPVETVLGKAKGSIGNIDFWNQALSSVSQRAYAQNPFHGIGGYLDLMRSLEQEASITFADRTLTAVSHSKSGWKEVCVSLMMSAQAAAQATNYYPSQFDLTVNDGSRKLRLKFSGADLKGLMRSYLSPLEFQKKIMMGWE